MWDELYIFYIKKGVYSPFFYVFNVQFQFFYIYYYIQSIMQYITKNAVNHLVLNINNNARPDFATYDLIFTHIMSKDVKTYTIDVNNPLQYTSNIRYCTITLDLEGANDLIYEGQYTLKIYGDGTDLVYVTMAVAEGVAESVPFTEYISNNEVNENYIYITE